MSDNDRVRIAVGDAIHELILSSVTYPMRSNSAAKLDDAKFAMKKRDKR